MIFGKHPTHGGTWLAMDNNSKISCRAEDEHGAALVITGSMELELGMQPEHVRQCIEVLGKALEDIRLKEIQEAARPE